MAEEEVDIDLTDPEVGKAAVKIQAGFKNYMANKKKDGGGKEEETEQSAVAAAKAAATAAADSLKKDLKEMAGKKLEEALADIDLNDPEVEKAATKIQATFRGYKTRKETTAVIEAK